MTLIAGRYRLLDALAEGAAGIVWRARDEALGREVAVKEVHAPPGLDASAERALYARVEREARAARAIRCPGVAEVYDVVVEHGRPWIVRELVRGLTLAETLEAGGPLPEREAARVALGVLAALRAAREAGVPYRGLGPDRVLLANDGRVVVTGLATGATGPETDGAAPGPGEDERSLAALLGGMAGSPLPGPLVPVVAGLAEGDGDARSAAVGELERIAGVRTAGDGASAVKGTPGPAGHAGGEEREEHGGRGGAGGGRPAGAAAPSGALVRRGGPRRGAVIAAGLAGLLVIVGALVWQAVRDEGPGTGPGGGGPSSTAPPVPGATGAGADG